MASSGGVMQLSRLGSGRRNAAFHFGPSDGDDMTFDEVKIKYDPTTGGCTVTAVASSEPFEVRMTVPGDVACNSSRQLRDAAARLAQ